MREQEYLDATREKYMLEIAYCCGSSTSIYPKINSAEHAMACHTLR